MAENSAPIDAVETLRTLLATAKELVEQVSDDPIRGRYLRLFDRIPAEDRPILIDVLEREVGLRMATQDGGATS